MQISFEKKKAKRIIRLLESGRVIGIIVYGSHLIAAINQFQKMGLFPSLCVVIYECEFSNNNYFWLSRQVFACNR